MSSGARAWLAHRTFTHHQPRHDLDPMAFSVRRAVASRLESERRLTGPLPAAFLPGGGEGIGVVIDEPGQRPALANLRAPA